MSDHFAIIGLPRSRTAWLSAFFTYGPCFCFHDGCQYGPSLNNLMRDVAIERPAILHVGNADSGLPFMSFGVGYDKTIIVQRPRVEAERSYMEYFTANPYPQLGPPDPERIKEFFDVALERVSRLSTDLEPGKVMIVPYSELDREGTVRAMWHFICPEEPFFEARWRALDQLRVNPMSSKVRLSLWV